MVSFVLIAAYLQKPSHHVICLYVGKWKDIGGEECSSTYSSTEDSWDKESVGDVFKTLVKEVGVVPVRSKYLSHESCLN